MSAAISLPAAEVIRGGEAQWIEDAGGAVIRDAAGKITGVDLHASWVTDSDLRKLANLPDLTHLDLSLTRITDQGMQDLRNLPAIVELNLRFAEYVTDEGLAAIKGWRRLKRLDVHGAKISDTTLEHIAGIASLEQLNIGSAMVTDVGLERLSGLPNLKELTMGGNELGDAGLQALRQLTGLTYLDLSGRQGTDSNVWAIAMSDTGLEALLTVKALKDLRFGCTFVGVGVEGSRFATVSAMNVTTRWLERIRALDKLERLSVQGCQKVDDESLAVLASYPNLRELDLKGTSVTDKGVAMFKLAKPKATVYTGPWEG
jgi:Leucine-rich repeat (LRR) protein